MKTLEDAVAALNRLEASVNVDIIQDFFEVLKAKVEPSAIASDAQGFIIEGAYQSGFDHIDDNADLLVVSCRKLIEFVEPRQRGRIEIKPGMDLSHLSSRELVILQQELHAEERCR